jgi:branched-chain amino acid transport system substrate-binding protein
VSRYCHQSRQGLDFPLMARIIPAFAVIAIFCRTVSAEPLAKAGIGLVLPLTGAHAQTAEAMKNAALLAYNELPEQARSQIRLIFEDDQLDASKALSAFNKLVSADRVSAVITFGGQSVAALAPLAAGSQTAMIALTADSNLVRGKPYVFQHWLTSDEQAKALFQALDRTGIKKVALVSTTHNAALDIRTKFETEALRRGMQVVYKEDYLPSTLDFRSELLKIKSSRPDAILGVLVLPHMGLFARQLRNAGMTLPLFCSVNAEAADEVQSSQGAMEGIVYAGPDLSPAFIGHFESQFGRYPEFAAAHVYDAIKLISQAVISGAQSGAGINARLLETRQFQGALGSYGLSDGYRFAVRAVPKQIKNGKFEKLELK